MSNMTEFPVPESFARAAWVDQTTYERMYEESIRDPDRSWGDHGKRLTGIKPCSRVMNASFAGEIQILEHGQ